MLFPSAAILSKDDTDDTDLFRENPWNSWILISMDNILPAHRQHPRRFEDFKFVYPVLSRRSHGISIGINTNPDKVCNFDCIYCQVDRSAPATIMKFDLGVAEEELRAMLEMVRSGELSQHPLFDSVPRELLRLNDIALSGDAEPTTLPNFSATIAMIVRVKPPDAKIVLITDAGGLDRADVKRGLEIMDANNGEVWAKLDAGTEDYFNLISRTNIPFGRILKNIGDCANARPVVIQSLFMKVHGVGPSANEITAYCQRLREIGNVNPARSGIKLVQVCTIARKPMTMVDGVPAWQFVTALTNKEVDAIAGRLRKEAGVTAESFYGE
jgi:wyosine [tRNA(Phe)-imidazoG37] synthetase (radical SAM superfamily)